MMQWPSWRREEYVPPRPSYDLHIRDFDMWSSLQRQWASYRRAWYR
jgi:hypothetical protein